MSRWQPGARDRLRRAALELFAEHGFAATTVPEITARAGLTTRTFFRHFADKREVLFAGEDEVPAVVAGVLADAPASWAPMAVVTYGLGDLVTTLFGGQMDYLRVRRGVVQADDALRERELHKLATLADSIRAAFRARGADEVEAALAAGFAVTTVNVAVNRWLDLDGQQDLATVVAETLEALRSVARDCLAASPQDTR